MIATLDYATRVVAQGEDSRLPDEVTTPLPDLDRDRLLAWYENSPTANAALAEHTRSIRR